MEPFSGPAFQAPRSVLKERASTKSSLQIVVCHGLTGTSILGTRGSWTWKSDQHGAFVRAAMPIHINADPPPVEPAPRRTHDKFGFVIKQRDDDKGKNLARVRKMLRAAMKSERSLYGKPIDNVETFFRVVAGSYDCGDDMTSH